MLQTHEASQSRFPGVLRVRTPRGMNRALELAARRNYETLSAMVRRVLLKELAQYGLTLTEPDDEGPLGRAVPIDRDANL